MSKVAILLSMHLSEKI